MNVTRIINIYSEIVSIFFIMTMSIPEEPFPESIPGIY